MDMFEDENERDVMNEYTSRVRNNRGNPDRFQRLPSVIPHAPTSEFQSLMNLLRTMHQGGGDISLNFVIDRSMEEGGNERDENITLDVECRQCRDVDAGQQCMICQSQFAMEEELTTLDECPHTFHHQCIMEWGKYNQICPVCRSEIPVV